MHNPVKNWRRQKYLKTKLNKIGTVLGWTMIYAASTELQKTTPYPVVLVELEDNSRAYGQLVDYNPETIQIGMKVSSTLRVMSSGATSEDVITYGLKFKPL